MKIVVLDGYALNPGDMSWSELQALGEVTIYDRTATADIVTRAINADAVLTNKTPLTAETLQSLPQLKYIGVLATGYNVVDIDAARRHGIVVTNIPAYSTSSVAQMVFAHLLAITNRVEYYTAENQSGRWSANSDFSYLAHPLTELAHKRMGIVGLGNIGSAVAQIALALGMEVAAYTSKPAEALPKGIAKVSLDELFATCDVVSLHCPLTAETRHMVNANRLRTMKPTAILINTGRGDLVCEQDLADALNAHTICAAGLDVLSQEPPCADNPLLHADNCYITPHIAWASTEARMRLMNITIENLKAFMKGAPQNCVSL